MPQILESPRGSCVLGGINAALAAVGRLCPIVHAGPGCCMQITAGEVLQSGGKIPYFLSGVSIPSSNMLEREVIFGGEQKLRDEIQGCLDIIDADAFFILNGCVPAIIGDDIKNVAEDFRKKGFPVYAIETPGFAGDSVLGYESAFKAFTDYLVKPSTVKQKNLVNLMGIFPYHEPFWEGNIQELTRILQELGLEVNSFFGYGQSIKNIQRSGEAALNIIVSPHLLKGTEKVYKEKFDVPSLRFSGVPIGATDTSNFVRKVGEALNLDKNLVEKVITANEKYVYYFYEQAIGKLSWKRFAVVGEANNVIGLTRFLANDYSFTPVITIVTDTLYQQEDKEQIKKEISRLEYIKPPEIIFEGDYYKVTQELKKHDITLLLGSDNEMEIAMEKGIQFLHTTFPVTERLVFNRCIAGYKGSLTLIEDLYDNL
ncbi:MAG: nitrogenase molybdenum-iron protein, alpha and beta chain [Elusimicrobiota bacterium]|jgi:nitrogenase molybdenum-iron protein beta chain|nr:nitrogenase molybdenum-iron protein, alpha and beta chain [Elusimicrobiota bacterium]